MALSNRFGSLRKRGDESASTMDSSFLKKKIYVTSQMAPRHSWGGTASTQTKIDVRNEELDAIKGNLAFRFKAAKWIYARVEDASVEPFARDESITGRSQLNKTTIFNVKKLLDYNSRPCRLDEMGVKLYYKYNNFIWRKLNARTPRPPFPAPAAASALANYDGDSKRPFAAVADDSSLMSAAKREKICSRIASKSCLPQVQGDVSNVSPATPNVGARPDLTPRQSVGVYVPSNQKSTFDGVNDRPPIPPKPSASSSSTESADSGEMCEDAAAAAAVASFSRGEKSIATPFSTSTFDGNDPRINRQPAGRVSFGGVEGNAPQLARSSASKDSLSHPNRGTTIPSASNSGPSADAVSNAPTNPVGVAASSSADSKLDVKNEVEVGHQRDPPRGNVVPSVVKTASSLVRPTPLSMQKKAVSFALPLDSAPDPASSDTPANREQTSTLSPGKKSKKVKPKVIPQSPVDGYCRGDPRTYGSTVGRRVVSDLRALDVQKLVSNWVKHELKQRKKKKTASGNGDDPEMGILLRNWRNLVMEKFPESLPQQTASGDSRGAAIAPLNDVKPNCHPINASSGPSPARRSVDPRPAGKDMAERRLGGRSEFPQRKSRGFGADERLSTSFAAIPERGDTRPTNLNKSFC